jgi:uncharacterized OB-fold protein
MTKVFTWPSDDPRLIGSRCTVCEVITFPTQSSCPHCTSTDVTEVELDRQGTLWTWTIQGFRPKSPPYKGDDTVDTFEPFGVGYVDLGGDLLIETRLTESDPERIAIGAELELVLVPLYRDDDGADVLTYAFRPKENGS